jgi:hypothetical protein
MSSSIFQIEQDTIFKDLKDFVGNGALSLELHKIEERIFRTLLRLGKSLLEESISNHGIGKVEGCIINNDHELKFHGTKRTTYLSIFGESKFSRAYYWTKGCSEGVHPLDAKLNLPAKKYSYFLGSFLNRGVADQTYDEVIENYNELFGINISKRTQEEIAISAGREFDKFVTSGELPKFTNEGEVLCIQADCKGIRMVSSEKPDEGKGEASGQSFKKGKGEKDGLRKMATATGDYSFTPQKRTPEELIKALMKEDTGRDKAKESEQRKALRENGKTIPGAPINTKVSATMASKEVAFFELINRVIQRDPSKSKPIVALIDGEKKLETELRQSLKAVNQDHRLDCVILDVIHMIEYLWKAGTALYGEKGNDRLLWVRKQALAVLEGRVGRVIGSLRQIITKRNLGKAKQKVLNKVITYFTNHKHMMKYDVYLEKGYPIATGFIEGTCGSLIRDRADKSGSRWTSEGVQSVLNMRAAKKNGWWDSYYNQHIENMKAKLYGNWAKSA